MEKIKSLKTIFLNKLKKNNVKFILNGKDSVDYNINITLPDTDGDFLFSKLVSAFSLKSPNLSLAIFKNLSVFELETFSLISRVNALKLFSISSLDALFWLARV